MFCSHNGTHYVSFGIRSAVTSQAIVLSSDMTNLFAQAEQTGDGQLGPCFVWNQQHLLRSHHDNARPSGLLSACSGLTSRSQLMMMIDAGIRQTERLRPAGL